MLEDEIYGPEPVINELIQSTPVQRLKGIHQGGASYLVRADWNVTRYEHSIGVMCLIQRLGGSVEEQIAGLLHDVSHTAFSHVIDFVLGNESEDFHEEIFEETLVNSKIPSILQKYGYSLESILNGQFSLLEQPLPLLCADRIDYTLRDLYRYQYITKGEVDAFLPSLRVVDNVICIKDIHHAEWFVHTYYREVQDFFMDPLNVYGYDKLITLLKKALQAGVISKEDFMLQDEEVLEKIRRANLPELENYIEDIISQVKLEENDQDFHIHLKGKPRLIDPSVIFEGNVIAASNISSKIREVNKKAEARALKGSYIKVIEKTRRV
ncbi:HD domain-containing protein [Fictibacillus nanhaiensis]|uniref:HD domain-containing protein n=1 Tax=Fictibacillus nanhaiensis TaxID=742169 RepID=UPI001C95346C|nr:HD domain-containing protein [Fictibacillus nanhaiensis]